MMDAPGGLPPLSEAQLEIMSVVWDRGEVTVADVWKALCTRRKVARNTVLTMLTRLEEKGWLKRDSIEHAHRYRATVPRDADAGDDDQPIGPDSVRRISRRADGGLVAWSGSLERTRLPEFAR